MTKLANDGLQVSLQPGWAQGQGQPQRSCDTGTIVLDLKSLFLTAPKGSIGTKLAHDSLQVSLHPLCAQGQAFKVKVKGHVIRALVCWHENRFFSQPKDLIATKLAHDGLQVSLRPGCAQGQGQGQRSRDTGTFVLDLKSLFLAGKWLDCDQTCTRWSAGEPASRVC